MCSGHTCLSGIETPQAFLTNSRKVSSLRMGKWKVDSPRFALAFRVFLCAVHIT